MLSDTTAPLVAVIEDDAGSRGALGRLLQIGGFEAVLFDSAEAFMATPPHRALLCLVLDVQLTGMSGIELLHRLRGEGSAIAVIITTGNREDAIRERAQQDGCTAFLRKPFSSETLLELLGVIAHQSGRLI
jgi:FixJ family two-component response regulator